VDDVVITPLTEVPPGFDSELAALWLKVTLGGGSVGFGTEVDPGDVLAVASRIVADAAAGRTDVLVLRGRDGTLVGTVRLERGSDVVVRHRAMLKLLMVDPERQGQGLGTRLVDACLELARDLGIEQVYLSARSATGLEEYYAKIGWQGVGRFPGGVRVAAGDDHDEVWFFKRISP